ncbi:MAG TPA: redoxin family protein, partial [Methanosarcinales archaeon]|nr:redoxin family protein [Methanosarcinales archaeon]
MTNNYDGDPWASGTEGEEYTADAPADDAADASFDVQERPEEYVPPPPPPPLDVDPSKFITEVTDQSGATRYYVGDDVYYDYQKAEEAQKAKEVTPDITPDDKAQQIKEAEKQEAKQTADQPKIDAVDKKLAEAEAKSVEMRRAAYENYLRESGVSATAMLEAMKTAERKGEIPSIPGTKREGFTEKEAELEAMADQAQIEYKNDMKKVGLKVEPDDPKGILPVVLKIPKLVPPHKQAKLLKSITDKDGNVNSVEAIKLGIRPEYLEVRGHPWEKITAAKIYVYEGLDRYTDKKGDFNYGKAIKEGVKLTSIAFVAGASVAKDVGVIGKLSMQATLDILKGYRDWINRVKAGGLGAYITESGTFDGASAIIDKVPINQIIKAVWKSEENVPPDELKALKAQIKLSEYFTVEGFNIAKASQDGHTIDEIVRAVGEQNRNEVEKELMLFEFDKLVNLGLIKDWEKVIRDGIFNQVKAGIVADKILNTKGGIVAAKSIDLKKLLFTGFKDIFTIGTKPAFAAPPDDKWKISKDGRLEWETVMLGEKVTFWLSKPDPQGLFREGGLQFEGEEYESKNPTQPCTNDSCSLEAFEFEAARKFVEDNGWENIVAGNISTKVTPVTQEAGIIRYEDIKFNPNTSSTWNPDRTIGKINQGVITTNKGMPDIKLTEYHTGKTQQLSDNDGKPSLLIVSGENCGACVAEYPTVNEFYDRYGGAVNVYFTVFSARVDEGYDKRVSNMYVKTNPDVDMPLMRMTNKDANTLGVTRTPSTFLVDKDGNITNFEIGRFNSVGDITGFTNITEESPPIAEPEPETVTEFEAVKEVPIPTEPSVWDKVQADPDKVVDLFKGITVGALVSDTPEEVEKTIVTLKDVAQKSGIEEWFNQVISKIGTNKEDTDKLANVWEEVQDQPPVVAKREIEAIADNISRGEQIKTESESKDIPAWQVVANFFTEPFKALSEGAISVSEYKRMQRMAEEKGVSIAELKRMQESVIKSKTTGVTTEDDVKDYSLVFEPPWETMSELGDAIYDNKGQFVTTRPTVEFSTSIMEPYKEVLPEVGVWREGEQPKELTFYNITKAISDGVPDPVLVTLFGKDKGLPPRPTLGI